MLIHKLEYAVIKNADVITNKNLFKINIIKQ